MQHNPIPVTYVADAETLANCIAGLTQASSIAFDLEFDSHHYTYGFNLCLLQMASSTHCYLVDPKAGIDISPVFRVLENPDIHKVAHCSSEDLRLLHSLQCYPVNLADTELYAKLLNYERTSLGAMLQQLFDVELDKKMQKVNWAIRPLHADQLDYAARDVLYLLQMEEELIKQGTDKGLLPFFEEENMLLETTIHQTASRDNFLKKKDMLYLSPYRQYVLNGMLRYRDDLAREQNKPAHYIIGEETIRDIVFGAINETDLKYIKNMHPVLKTKEGQGLLYKQLKQLHQEATSQELSGKKSNPYPAVNFQAEKARKDQLKADIFAPIQQEIAAIFGEHAMRFIFSTSAVNSILDEQLTIEGVKPAYRKKLVQDTAAKLGVDISRF